MKLFLIVLGVFTLVKPLGARPYYVQQQDEFDNDDPDTNEYDDPDTDEYRDEGELVKYGDDKAEEYDQEFLDAQKAYEDLQKEIKRMQETLGMLKSFGIPEGTNSFHESQDDSADLNAPQLEREADAEGGNTFAEQYQYPQEVSEPAEDDDADAIEEDAKQNAAQGVEEDEAEEGDFREEYDQGDEWEGDNNIEEEEEEQDEAEEEQDEAENDADDSPKYENNL